MSQDNGSYTLLLQQTYSTVSHLSMVRAPTRQPMVPRAPLVTSPVTEKISWVRTVEGKHWGRSWRSWWKGLRVR